MPTKAAPFETLPAPKLEGTLKPPRMLTDVFREQLRLRRYARRTEETYVGWTRDFIRFHRGRHAREMGGSEVRVYLTYLASERNVAAATQRQALNALVSLYDLALEKPLGDLCISGGTTQPGPAHGNRAPTSCGRVQRATGGKKGGHAGGIGWTKSDAAYLAPFVCHSSSGKRLRHPNRSRTARTQGRGDDANLHARDAETGVGNQESAGRVSSGLGFGLLGLGRVSIVPVGSRLEVERWALSVERLTSNIEP